MYPHRASTLLFLVGLGLAALAPACESAGTSAGTGLSRRDEEAIRSSTEAWEEAARRGDWAAAAANYTEDALLFAPGQPPISGRKAIREWLQTWPPVGSIDLEIQEIEGCQDLACVRGVYRLTLAPPGADTVQDSGRFFEIRRRQPDGSWLIARDFTHSGVPGSR